MKFLLALTIVLLPAAAIAAESGPGWVHYAPEPGKERGRKIVLLAGDEEYRSEESLPMLAKILSRKHGFDCTVLFSHAADGAIDPNAKTSLGRPEALDSADVIVMLLRFRAWPDETMRHFDAALRRGVPVVALRTSTHAFQFPKDSAFQKYNGFGKNVLGETWVSHWGSHKHEATRGVIEAAYAKHPVLRGVKEIFGDSDVYEVAPPADATVLVRGQVLSGMKPNDPPATQVKKRGDGAMQPVNDPMMPVAWLREVKNDAGTSNRILCTTMGAASDLQSEGLRRLVVNGVFWGLKLEVPDNTDVRPLDAWHPLPYGFNGFRKGVRAMDHELPR